MEKYLVLSWGDHIVFKDSLQFMAASLEALTANLLKSGKENFDMMRKDFEFASDANFDLLLRKGVYPYDYADDWDKFNDQQLPPHAAFFSNLRNSNISAEDYAHAQNVWKVFQCHNFQDYMELYLRCDVLQLACIFEAFRNVCLTHYELDPAHFVSAPNLTWDAMLKITEAKLDLISDPEMFKMLDNGIRGGICVIVKRLSRANNPLLPPEFYDPTQLSRFLLYLDANNLYGWAMSQIMPHGNFKWMSEDEFKNIDWLHQTDEQTTGYFVECDLVYPPEIHDEHNDYPMAPERMVLHEEMISETQSQIVKCYNISRSAMTQTKLVPNLMDKNRYVVHYINLQFYLEHGM